MEHKMKNFIKQDNFVYVLLTFFIIPDWEYPIFTVICYLSGLCFLFTLRKQKNKKIEIVAFCFMFVASIMGIIIFESFYSTIIYACYAIAIVYTIFTMRKDSYENNKNNRKKVL